MPSKYYQKSRKHLVSKERNDKIRRLWAEGITVSVLSKRFGLIESHVRYILKGAKDGQKT